MVQVAVCFGLSFHENDETPDMESLVNEKEYSGGDIDGKALVDKMVFYLH